MSSAGEKRVVLTTHPGQPGIDPIDVQWGAADPAVRGPILSGIDHAHAKRKNAIGAPSGSYSVYRALAIARGALSDTRRPDLTNTFPAEPIGPFPSWGDAEKIVSLDPWGAMVQEVFGDYLAQGYDIRPSIAITKAHINIPELKDYVSEGLCHSDGKILRENNDLVVTKASIDPVWYIPGVARRFGVEPGVLRRTLFETTGGMFPELITRPDLEIFLPPIGGTSIYIIGNPSQLGKPETKVTVRVHDECNGSDVFGSDICTCRPYLVHGIAECVNTAQAGGVGVIAYNRKEGRALGEVTKYLVYNARKRQQGGDLAETYFLRTECVAGVQDMRFQELMPDCLNWLGITRIDRLISMSDMKYDAIVQIGGIQVVERVPIPSHMIPPDAQVEIQAKMAAGYFKPDEVEKPDLGVKGRNLTE
jgi:GTP cyclohydrolase II